MMVRGWIDAASKLALALAASAIVTRRRAEARAAQKRRSEGRPGGNAFRGQRR